jgi:uncharacterized RDD family membrane protein YckC
MAEGLYCQSCGQLNDAHARFCSRCGAAQPQTAAGQPSGVVAPPSASGVEPPPYPLVPPVGGVIPPGYPAAPPAAAAEFRGYGGFWIRFLAFIIDWALLGVIMMPLKIIFFGGMVAVGSHISTMGEPPDPRIFLAILPIIMLYVMTIIGIYWLYEALMTSSSKQATLGKMALSLKVTDKNGNRLSFLHATGRHFAKIINNLTLLVGWIMAGFTDRKQGLHDMIAGTYVIKV